MLQRRKVRRPIDLSNFKHAPQPWGTGRDGLERLGSTVLEVAGGNRVGFVVLIEQAQFFREFLNMLLAFGRVDFDIGITNILDGTYERVPYAKYLLSSNAGLHDF